MRKVNRFQVRKRSKAKERNRIGSNDDGVVGGGRRADANSVILTQLVTRSIERREEAKNYNVTTCVR